MEPKMTVKKSRRKFRRQNWFWKQKLGVKWRRPGGNQSKMRRKWKSKMVMAGIGYKQKLESREMLKGFRPVVVYGIEDLQDVDGGASEGVVIASAIGAKSALEIEKKAKELNLRILNPRALGRAQRAVRAIAARKEERKKAAEESKKKVKEEESKAKTEKAKLESKAETKTEVKEKPKQEKAEDKENPIAQKAEIKKKV